MYISLDLETTGVDDSKDKIIEFGAVIFDETGQKETLSLLIDPGITLPQIITYITNIKDSDLEGKPTITEKLDEIRDFIKDYPIIGHNIQFDTGFLRVNGIELNNPEYDTLQLASMLLPNLPSYSLEILSHELGLNHQEKHRALDDAIAAMELFNKLLKRFAQLPKDTFEEIQKLVQKSDWPMKEVFKNIENTPKEIQTETTPHEKPELSTTGEQILKSQHSNLYQLPHPYNKIAEELATHGENCYIAVSPWLFAELSDEINKIDLQKNYLSEERLKEFENKPNLTNFEVTALVKYVIWNRTSKTKNLKEITLFRDEKKTISKINADPDIIGKIDQPHKTPILCTHQYIIEENPKIEELIIIDFEKFTQSLFFNASTYITLDTIIAPLSSLQDIHPENQTIHSLIAKVEIITGLIGLFFEKYNDKSPYTARATIEPLHLTTKEWADINASINNLIEISTELGEINNEKTAPFLKKWKEVLTTLKDTFAKPDIEEKILIIEKNFHGEITTQQLPVSLAPYLNNILDNCEKYKIIDESLEIQDNGRFTKSVFGLPDGLEVQKQATEEKNMDIYITKTDDNVYTPIKEYIEKKRGKTALIFNSRQQIEIFTLKLAQDFQDTDINIISQLTGSQNKLGEKYNQAPEKSILLLTKNTWENFKYCDKIDTVFIHKIPFDAPSHPMIFALSQVYKNPFIQYSLPKATFSMKKILNRLPGNGNQVILLDPRIHQKDYGKIILKSIEEIATPKLLDLASVSKTVK